MVDLYDDAGTELFHLLLEMCPEWEQNLEPGIPSQTRYQTVHPKLHIPSEHPTIQAPLTIELGGTLQLFWHGGYFYDFLGKDKATDAFDFLCRFFKEEVRCLTCWSEGKVVAGGPVEANSLPAWIKDYDRIEARSWRGNCDEVLRNCRE